MTHLAQNRLVTTTLMTSIMAVVCVAATWAQTPEKALPEPVLAAIQEMFPNGRIKEVETERRIVRLVEVTIKDHGQEYDVTLTNKGTLLFVKQEIDPDALPPAVSQTIQAMSNKARINEAERVTIYAEFRAMPINQPRIEYETEFRMLGKEHQATVSENGTTLKTPKHLRYNDN